MTIAAILALVALAQFMAVAVAHLVARKSPLFLGISTASLKAHLHHAEPAAAKKPTARKAK